MNILRSAKNNAFFYEADLEHYARAGWDISDIVAITEQVFQTFTNPPSQKIRIVGSDGLPAWGDIPPPTPEQLQEQAESQKQYLMSQATKSIAPLQYAVDLEMATDGERAALTAWKKYCVLLNRVDCSAAPDIDWPKAPE
ncbi:tail fiber assembly protein [Xenorhabdus szentirmaii]|uniref:tail fiber assembly protein n=1 Tax=Xenorhabdus szentirmaii TaxID=290112 RepID=UPI0032B76F8A